MVVVIDHVQGEWQAYTGDELGFQSFFGPVGVFILIELIVVFIMAVALHWVKRTRIYVRDTLLSFQCEYDDIKTRALAMRVTVAGILLLCIVNITIVILDFEFVKFVFPSAYHGSEKLRNIGRM